MFHVKNIRMWFTCIKIHRKHGFYIRAARYCAVDYRCQCWDLWLL